MRFEKWTALGNDYLIVEESELPWELTAERIGRLCDAQTGIGSDGILLLSPAEDEGHVAELRIFNPDGSEAELSGNGARQAVLYLRQRGWTDDDSFAIHTKAGEVRAEITGGVVAMDLGRASLTSPDYPAGPADGMGTVTAGGREWAFQHVNVGNPQCVIDAGDEVEELGLAAIGPEIENSELFPNRTNVSFISVDHSTVRARIFERGVGETASSGTGATGAAVAAHLRGSQSPITVRLDGGELTVEVSDDLGITLTGTAEPVAAGSLAPELIRALGNEAEGSAESRRSTRTAADVVAMLRDSLSQVGFAQVRDSLEARHDRREAQRVLGKWSRFMQEAVDPEIEIDFSRSPPAGITPDAPVRLHGWAGWVEMFRLWFEPWEEYHPSSRIEAIDDEYAINEVEDRMVGRGSGVELVWRCWQLWRVRDGRVVSLRQFETREEALRAAREDAG